MGRHSAPDDDEDGDVLVDSAPVLDAPARGRHARPDEGEAPAEATEPVAETAAEPDLRLVVDASAQPSAPRVGKGNQPTADDLELLREHADVRNRVIAAVLAPFVIYTIAMYLGGALDVYFIWVWLPLVTAGVLAGSILDAAHRKRARTDEPG